tara:strand:+ start:794 stop:925 length:132 start_codon:yes stop_codon:yes gene_type:complete
MLKALSPKGMISSEQHVSLKKQYIQTHEKLAIITYSNYWAYVL